MKYSCYQESSVITSVILLFMAGLFTGFWLRNASLVKFGNSISEGIVFVFQLAFLRKRV